MVMDLAAPAARTLAPARRRAPAPTLLHVLPSFAVGGVQVRLARVINAVRDRRRPPLLALAGRRPAAPPPDPGVAPRADPMPREKRGLPAPLFALRQRIAAAKPDL